MVCFKRCKKFAASAWDPFEASISTILGQLVSVERGRALVTNLMDLVGEEVIHDGKPVRLFPTPEALAAADLSTLGTIAKMSPWRGYVATLLWLEYAGKLVKPKS